MNYSWLTLFSLQLVTAYAQFFETFAPQTLPVAIQPPPLQQATFQPAFQQAPVKERVLPHRAVVLNAENEAKLPQELQNAFYKNPRTAAFLAKDSWFGPGEMQVINREADKIPRQQVFKLLRQAGLAKRR